MVLHGNALCFTSPWRRAGNRIDRYMGHVISQPGVRDHLHGSPLETREFTFPRDTQRARRNSRAPYSGWAPSSFAMRTCFMSPRSAQAAVATRRRVPSLPSSTRSHPHYPGYLRLASRFRCLSASCTSSLLSVLCALLHALTPPFLSPPAPPTPPPALPGNGPRGGALPCRGNGAVSGARTAPTTAASSLGCRPCGSYDAEGLDHAGHQAREGSLCHARVRPRHRTACCP